MITNEQLLDLEQQLKLSEGPYTIESMGFGQGVHLKNKAGIRITEITYFTARDIKRHFDIAKLLLDELKELKGIK